MDPIERFIELITYMLLGIVQGVTEPLPISSSGHLVIFRELWQVETSGLSFEIIVHFGSLIAIIILYRKEINSLLNESYQFLFRRKKGHVHSFRYVLYLFIATIMTGVLGLAIESFITTKLATLKAIGYSLIVTGIFLWFIHKLHGEKSDHMITWKDACLIGILQTLALIPGISRSGVTIVVAMLLGFKRETAIRFSFLLYIPVTLGVQLLSLNTIFNDPLFTENFILYIIAFLIAIIATYIALKWFVSIMLRGRLIIFTIYCLLVGGALIFMT